MADIVLAGSVGLSGTNQTKDVRNVQNLLNGVIPEWGGPATKLTPSGISGSLTRNAILGFQTFQLGTVQKPDSRVDPKGRTLKRLNHIASTPEKPNQSLFVSGGPVRHEKQPTNLVCWAAAGTMLVNARDRSMKLIPDVMNVADENDPGPQYLKRFSDNRGLQPVETARYTQAIGLAVEPPINFTVKGWVGLMRHKGALGVVALTPFLHIRVVREMAGDGTIFGTLMTVNDPGFSQPYTEVFQTFVERYEAAAPAGNVGYFQIWHR